MSESATPDTGALSFDQAVASLTAPEPDAQGEAPESAQEAAPEDQDSEPPSSAAEDAGEADEPGDSEDADAEPEAEADPLSAPQYWTKEEKEFFAAQNRQVQEILLNQETKRQSVVDKAKQEAADIRKAAQQEIQQAQQLASKLNQLLPNAEQVFRSKWAGVEQPGYWQAVRQQYGVDYERDLRDQFEFEARQLHQMAAAKQDADRLAREQRIKDTEAKLPELAPELSADPARWTRTKDFLVTLGADPHEVDLLGPVERALAYDAMRFRQAKTATSQQPKPKPAAKAPPRAVARQIGRAHV